MLAVSLLKVVNIFVRGCQSKAMQVLHWGKNYKITGFLHVAKISCSANLDGRSFTEILKIKIKT